MVTNDPRYAMLPSHPTSEQFYLTSPSSSNLAVSPAGPPLTDEHIQAWVNQLEQWTNVFYNEQPNTQNIALWQEAQSKLVQFQKIHDPFELCSKILKVTKNSLVLYQSALCLKNAVTSDFKKIDPEDLFELFQFLYEFMSSRNIENSTDMSVNETVALICAMVLKRIASEPSKTLTQLANTLLTGGNPTAAADVKIKLVITTLCGHIKDKNEPLSRKLAAAMTLRSILLESQMTNRSSLLGIRVWKHLNARRLIEVHLRKITEVALEAINWAFASNQVTPITQNNQNHVQLHYISTLIHCVEYSLSFDSLDSGWSTGGDRLIRVIQTRTINMCSNYTGASSSAMGSGTKESITAQWFEFLMSNEVVQFLFGLYTTVKQMISCNPGWSWPANVLKNCLNCLYYLSDIHNSMDIRRDSQYIEFVGNLMLGVAKIMDSEVTGVDDSFQIAYLITSISLHTSEVRDTISKIKREHLIPFLDSAQRFTTKIFTKVASITSLDDEEEEEKTVDALLDFWYHILRNIDADLRLSMVSLTPTPMKMSTDTMKAYSRTVVEHYISCHLHKPLGQLEPRSDDSNLELDLDKADEQDDNSIHGQQLVSFSMISRFDALHTAKVLIQLFSTRLAHLETLLTQYINTKESPYGLKDWEYINDDLHWLMLMLQHYLTQTGYGEIGFMCGEILNASFLYGANVQKTLEAFEKCDYTSSEVDPIVRLILIALKICQIEMGICQSGKIEWLSVQTNATLTSLLSRFCLTYLYPKESDYTVISENMNYCFGQDAPTAEKFLKFVIEHTCCIIMYMKADAQIVRKNVQLLIQLITFHPIVKNIFTEAGENSMIKTFTSQMRPDKLTGFSPKVAKSIIRLATRLFIEDDDWDKLIAFFSVKWEFIISSIRTNQHQNSELVATKFLEFCDFAIGVCEACDDDTSERLFERLLVPIVEALPAVLEALADHESVPVSVFELLYYIAKLPMVNISGISWESTAAKTFYEHCMVVIGAYSKIAAKRKNRGNEEEDCEDIIGLLSFIHEVMKRDWGITWASCDAVVKFAMEHLSSIMKPEYLQLPKIRAMYYRLLVYLVDEDERLEHLNDKLLETIVTSVIHALESTFDKDTDNHVYTIIGIICRAIYSEGDEPLSQRLSAYMRPVLPVVFNTTMNHGSYTINTETAELVAPAIFSLRCCFLDDYQMLVKDLIERQDDPHSKAKIKSLFENLELKIQKLTLNRTSCREFNTLFVPFLAELHNYITTK